MLILIIWSAGSFVKRGFGFEWHGVTSVGWGDVVGVQIAERGHTLVEGQLHEAGGAVAVFGNMNFSQITFVWWYVY